MYIVVIDINSARPSINELGVPTEPWARVHDRNQRKFSVQVPNSSLRKPLVFRDCLKDHAFAVVDWPVAVCSDHHGGDQHCDHQQHSTPPPQAGREI